MRLGLICNGTDYSAFQQDTPGVTCDQVLAYEAGLASDLAGAKQDALKAAAPLFLLSAFLAVALDGNWKLTAAVPAAAGYLRSQFYGGF